MSLRTCKACGNSISRAARQCPKCGHRYRSLWSKLLFAVFLGSTATIVAVFGAMMAVAPELKTAAPEQPKPVLSAEEQQALAKQQELERKHYVYVEEGRAAVKLIKKAAKDPESFVLEQGLITDAGAACITYRARNGFGGYTRGQAVLTSSKPPKGRQLLLSETSEDAFLKKWKTECEGKRGREFSLGRS